MGLALWVLLFAADCLFCLWVLRWGGASWLLGWRVLFFVDWFRAPEWNAEQVKLYVLLCWTGHACWFLLGLGLPELRF